MQRLKVTWWYVAGFMGSVEFWLFQVLTGPSTTPQFMGQQIVEQGGYPKVLTFPIGWGIHLGMSLGYSLLFAIIMLIPFSRSPFARLAIGAAIALVLGWFATLLTVPAITVTINVLSGQGFPATLPRLNTTFGLPFWNHLLFFGVVWGVYLLIPYLRSKATPRQSVEICMFDDGTQCQNPRSEGSHLCEVHMHMSLDATDMDREVFRVVNDRYMQDVREFFTRSNFYLVAEGGLLSVFFARNVPNITSDLLNWGVVALGLVLALLWWLVAWGALYWIRRWRQEVWRLDTSLNRFHSITRVEGTFTRRRWSQPEYVTKFLPIGFSVVWVVLAVVLCCWRP